MKAMIFAAGLGTRLKPITDTLPKALVPVCGKPLIEHICMKLMNAGINEAVVNVHHFADKIEDWAMQQDWIATSAEGKEGKMKIAFSDERALLLETGGAILHARRFLEGCGHFLVHNVDILSNADLQWMESEVKQEAIATLLVSERKTSRYFLFHPQTMRLVGWQNTKTGEHILTDDSLALEDCRALGFSGIHILSDKVLVLMQEYVESLDLPIEDPQGVRFGIRDFYLWAAAKHPIYGVSVPDLELLDVGKLDALEPAEQFIKRG